MPDADSVAKDLELLREAGKRAGEIAFSFFRNNPKSWFKGGTTSSVSEADMAVDAFLKEKLLSARPAYGWLSEETTDTPERLEKQRLFIVDPIDGTRAFLQGNPDWCVAIAMIEDNRPQAAVLVAPVLDKTYWAEHGKGAYCNGARLHVSEASILSDLRVASPPHHGPWSLFQSGRIVQFIPSLALRLARVASGELDAAFAKADAHDWDIASSHLLIEEAGGALVDFAGDAPLYNRPGLSHPPLAAFGPQIKAMMLNREAS